MIGELLINGTDVSTIGVEMGDGFIDALLTPAPMKACVENSSRMQNGKTILNYNPKFDTKDLSLTFRIFGNTKSEYLTNMKAFYAILYGQTFNVKIPPLGDEVYKLHYLKPTTYNGNVNRTSSKVTLSFEEPNPNDRT